MSRFRGKLVKMIKDAGNKFDDYSISRIGVSYRLTEKNVFIKLANQCIKMSYYWFNGEEILQNAKERYSKEKAAQYYLENKEGLKKKSKD